MLVVMHSHATPEQIEQVTAAIRRMNLTPHPLPGSTRTAIGIGTFTIIAGPCSVENEEMILRTAEFLRGKGVNLMRAGAFKPRTSPYAFQGLGQKGLDILARARQKTGIGVVC